MKLKRRLFRWWMSRRIRKAKAVLRTIDQALKAANCPAWKRQQIRRDIITSDTAWVDFLRLMEVKK